ncbi:hypothetical protein MPL1032_230033 [Mesorhizobium plurifarium]|uniref:Uncharacterized protein n=1 Tax=Mesorhizobium plurifarium TaxID=69974 RepID=A0A0K2VZ90_MESPL|nr:hypothetical protein MPL1032_230033 [Mesorhizobium plurifarium]
MIGLQVSTQFQTEGHGEVAELNRYAVFLGIALRSFRARRISTFRARPRIGAIPHIGRDDSLSLGRFMWKMAP